MVSLKESNFAASLNTGIITIKPNFKIVITVSNKFIAKQIEENRSKILTFLREKLTNYGITLSILVNEKVEKKQAYTKEDKYKRLSQKNPLLEKLKNTFNLEL